MINLERAAGRSLSAIMILLAALMCGCGKEIPAPIEPGPAGSTPSKTSASVDAPPIDAPPIDASLVDASPIASSAVSARGPGAQWSFNFCRVQPTGVKDRICGDYSAFDTTCAPNTDPCVKLVDHVTVAASSTAYNRNDLSRFAESAVTAVFGCTKKFPAHLRVSVVSKVPKPASGSADVTLHVTFDGAREIDRACVEPIITRVTSFNPELLPGDGFDLSLDIAPMHGP